MITINTPDIIYVNNYDHTFQMRVVYVDMPASDEPATPVIAGTTTNFIRLTNTVKTGSKTYIYTFRVLPTGYQYLKGYIVLGDNHMDMRTVHIFQQNEPEPIWKDVIYSYSGTQSPVRYQIVDEHMNVIYDGVNQIMPGDALHKFVINRIVADHLHIDDFIGFDYSEWISMGGGATYGLVYNGTLQKCYRFVWNWEYKTYNSGEYYSSNRILNRPINGHLADWQKWNVPVSMYYARDVEEPFVWSETYTTDDEEHYAPMVEDMYEKDTINFMMYSFGADPVKKATLHEFNYKLEYEFGHCGEMALYYKNRLGGIDTLLIEGAVEKTDKFDRKNISVDYYNQSPIYNGKPTVFTNVNTVYKLTTGLLTDEQSETLVEQLIPSQDVLLYDPTTLKFTSVNITDSSVTYQTFKNNGRRFSQYTITVEETHDKFIK